MKKRADFSIRRYIRQNLKKGFSESHIKRYLTDYGYSSQYIRKEFDVVNRQRVLAYSVFFIALFASLFFLVKPTTVGYAVYDASYPAVYFASGDFSSQKGIVYQGRTADNEQKAYQGKSALSIQGKQHGSVNIVDYNKDGNDDLFTTGYYTNSEGDEIAATNLYDNFQSNVGSFINLRNSDSCWGDFDNNGFEEPAIIGRDDDNNRYFQVYKNTNGQISSDYSLGGLKFGSIECFDSNGDGYDDLVVCGEDTNGEKYSAFYRSNNGVLTETQTFSGMKDCSITVNDFTDDGFADIIIAGENTNFDKVVLLLQSDGSSFSGREILDSLSLTLPSVSSGDYDGDGWVDFAISGSSGGSQSYIYSNINGDFQQESLDLTKLRHSFHSFADIDGDTVLDFFIVGEDKPSVGGGTPKTQLITEFASPVEEEPEPDVENETIEEPTLEEEPINETITPILNPFPETDVEDETRWTETRNFNHIKYFAQYQHVNGYTLVEEIILNEDIYAHDEVYIFHNNRYRIDEPGEYSIKDDKIDFNIGLLNPGEGEKLIFLLSGEVPFENIIPTQIRSKRFIPPKPVVKEILNITEDITIEENKTIIPINLTLNESILAEEGVCVNVHIPECLSETINELSFESNREFSVVGESIRFCFENIVEQESFSLQVNSIADEQCLNEIRAEKLAKNILVQKDKFKPANALVLLVTVIFLTIPTYLFINNAKKQQRNVALIVFAIGFIILNIFDTAGLLPESLDFLKKLFSWVLMISLLYHVSLRHTLLSGHEDQRKGILFNVLLLSAFIMLSMKNLIYVAFKTYAKEKWFSDLLMPIIKFSPLLLTYSSFIGLVIILLATLYVVHKIMLAGPSFASLIHKTEYSFITGAWKKPLYVLLIFLGFYMTFFNFLFGWFSIAFDGPFLILVLLVVGYSTMVQKKGGIREIPDKADTLIEKFMKLFTHEKNVFIAFSAFPLVIFVVVMYSYLVYMLFGVRNIYFEGIEVVMPILDHLSLSLNLWPLYLLQLSGLVCALVLAFLFWWHFFMQREHANSIIKDRPDHPLLFSLFVTAFVSFIIRPIFRIATLDNENLGILITLKETVPADMLTPLYVGLSVLFIVCYLFFRDSKKTNIIPYAMVLFTVVYVNVLYMKSIFSFVDLDVIDSFGISEFIVFMTSVNSAFFIFMTLLYLVILAFSLYALAGEFLHLVKEEFSDNKFYRKLMVRLFAHKVVIPEHQKHQIKKYMEDLLEKGEEDYLVIEHIHKHTHLPLKEISLMLRELEEDDEQKQRYHHINHYHHNLGYIKMLYKSIKKQYYKMGIDAETIIDNCLKKGVSQDDIAAAMMHIHYKKKDRELFAAMRQVNL